jgi:hypothetical protein
MRKKTIEREGIRPEVISMRENEPSKKSFLKAARNFACLVILGTLAIMQPDGDMKFYATFPMGTQMSVLELDSGRTWMIRATDERGSSGTVTDYDNGDMYRWNTTDGCRRCGDWQQWEK